MPKSENNDVELIRTWTLATAVTIGSSVRAKGILQEAQARLPAISKKALSLEGTDLVLSMPADQKAAFNAAVSVVATTMEDAPTLPVIPREIEDILGMKTSERHRWLADGRLPSIGTRTVRLAGRARQITFHVFDPKVVEDLLDRGAVDEWRVEDVEAKADKRRRAAYQAKLRRLIKKSGNLREKTDTGLDDSASRLRDWEDFDVDGLLY
ncbi:hypothetical protein J2X76_005584 [Neorhizobium sp. 2083]|uniref:hypothetical protein n=1 Tax=Neorhizobium sp. 2083 TaxID=2817762 RepID=UPI0028641080|nr:hypothetical protein [Neorhizobium sp. 2083]MDR6820387.1 hypothetical protein [Neorhizobium sp. 2083]